MSDQTLRSNPFWAPATWLLVAMIFVADIFIPRQFDVASGYLLVIFLGVLFREKNDVMLLVIASTVLAIIGAAFKLDEAPLDQLLSERVASLFGIWVAGFFVIRFIGLRNEEEVQQERFKALFQFASNGILLTDRKGRIVLANPSAEELFGYERGGLVGLTVEKLIPSRYHERHREHREYYHRSPRARTMGIGLDLFGMRRDGTEFPVEVSLSPFQTPHGDFTVAFLVDNTYRKNYEHSILNQKQELANLTHALQVLNETLETKVSERTTELEQAKNDLAGALDKERELGELKSRFVSMASHEFRTPLSAVLSSASLIASYAERQDYENIKKHTERIKNAVNGLNTILTEFLSLGKLEEGHIRPNMETMNLPAVVHEVANEMKNLFRAGQDFLYSHEGPETVLLDAGLLRNIMINLVSNAIKYSPEKSRITVRSMVDGQYAHISVRDEGIGIPDSDQKHLFSRFFRASNATNIHGTGLGLYIVRRYVDMMNGQIGYRSEMNKGSEFWVKFPI